MAKKCVHKGCGKEYEDEKEDCVYHPGPPVFHEGQKGWKCCKTRVLTFDEFLTIPPCTTGTHSEVDDTPAPEPKPSAPDVPSDTAVELGSLQESLPAPVPRLPTSQAATPRASTPVPPEEDEDDDPSLEVKEGMTCKRKGCGQKFEGGSRDAESCVHHPGAPVFHEGSKGWSCCKRRVLEFDQFMNIEGCKTKEQHLFVGSGKKTGEEKLETVKHDFYQTATSVIASLYLKKIAKDTAKIDFQSTHVNLDLRTTDSKRYETEFPLYGVIDPAQSKFRILGTKLEMTLVKADGASWPVLRSDDKLTGEILQVGRAGRV
ncbi:chord-domain-containing protein [Massarina eburnea CBS 473.64]|uniref:Chord-domain-containing protein n=1 Tax=Massarina eburnea CBS 473.64 TaxID=1395130 RepID=A0A6A6RVY7_9PLEO|nr:chord-domain-containing protein [Massarina eburnea CBS 473.64]